MAPWDSDLEADPDPPDWTRNLDSDVVDKMTPKEKQRQEVVNGTSLPSSLPLCRAFDCLLFSARLSTSAARQSVPVQDV